MLTFFFKCSNSYAEFVGFKPKKDNIYTSDTCQVPDTGSGILILMRKGSVVRFRGVVSAEPFNGNEFFNGEYMNIRNQFLSSIYDAPGKVDLFQLLYRGSGLEDTLTKAEKAAVIAYNGWDMEPDCACTKIRRSNMDTVLTEYMGMTLADTERIGLENYTYLEGYDAYYYYHGDTNYRITISFSGGEREGNIIRLFYDYQFMSDGKKVLTLREQAGSYLYVSNIYQLF